MNVTDRTLRQGIELGVADYVAVLEFYIVARTILDTRDYDPRGSLGAGV